MGKDEGQGPNVFDCGGLTMGINQLMKLACRRGSADGNLCRATHRLRCLHGLSGLDMARATASSCIASDSESMPTGHMDSGNTLCRKATSKPYAA